MTHYGKKTRFICNVLIYSKVVNMLATGEGILTQKDGTTADGMQEVFATNLFGHFLLVSFRLCHCVPPPSRQTADKQTCMFLSFKYQYNK